MSEFEIPTPLATKFIAADAVTAAKIASSAVGATQLDGTYPDASIKGPDIDLADIAGNNLSVDTANDELDGTTASTTWTKDGDQSATGVTSDTYTLSGTYDVVMVGLQLRQATTNNTSYKLQANGVGTGYDYVDNSDTLTTSTASVDPIAKTVADNRVASPTLIVQGRFDDKWQGGQAVPQAATGIAVGFDTDSPTSPLDSLTVKAGNSFDVEWDVRGRDVVSGGLP